MLDKGNTVPFKDAKPRDESLVYSAADGEDIGDVGWVTDLDWFDDSDGPIVLKRQTWRLVKEDVIIVPDVSALCPTCKGDGAVPSPVGVDVDCATCKGDGADPRRHDGPRLVNIAEDYGDLPTKFLRKAIKDPDVKTDDMIAAMREVSRRIGRGESV